MLDHMFDYIEHIRSRPVWQPMDAVARANLRSVLPVHPTDLARVHQDFLRDVMPYATGNVHPGFMGWVHGGGSAVGMLADMLAAGLNANCGGRDHAPIEVERQITEWARTLFGFPDGATGLEVRQAGLGTRGSRLLAYASTGTHACITRALDYAGLGSEALRLVPVDGGRRGRTALVSCGRRVRRPGRFSP
jgi:glutamate/tyrosine decarboxylase-like PLP-dependent enzyme